MTTVINTVQRFKKVRDNDGHRYIICVEDEKLFDLWVLVMEHGDGDDLNDLPDFEDDRIDGGDITFLDPRIDGQLVGAAK
jgi:hypothetical protein